MATFTRHRYTAYPRAANILSAWFSRWYKQLSAAIARSFCIVPCNMIVGMINTIRYLKIVYMIVSFVAIYVVDKFIRFKRPSEKLRHNKSMFWNVSKFSSHRMVRTYKYLNVSVDYCVAETEAITVLTKSTLEMFPGFPSLTHGLSLARCRHYGN